MTRHGQPLFVSVQFTEELLRYRLRPALATAMFKQGDSSISQAAKAAGMSYANFVEHVSMQSIPVVNYNSDEIKQELKVLDA